jgi:hypothetical protein
LTVNSGFEDDFVLYTKAIHQASSTTEAHTLVRWKKRNVVWCGEGGMLASESNSTYNSRFPFWIETNYQPKHNSTLYNQLSSKPVYGADNSAIFANIMAWAIYQAEYHGINSAGINPFN